MKHLSRNHDSSNLTLICGVREDSEGTLEFGFTACCHRDSFCIKPKFRLSGGRLGGAEEERAIGQKENILRFFSYYIFDGGKN